MKLADGAVILEMLCCPGKHVQAQWLGDDLASVVCIGFSSESAVIWARCGGAVGLRILVGATCHVALVPDNFPGRSFATNAEDNELQSWRGDW